jgi:exonuclease SbcC
MIIKEIELNNIRSHVHTTINFTDGINIITGNTGSGKSSILMALEYALFGKIGEGREEGKMLLRRGESTGSIAVKFGESESEYYIKRGLKRTAGAVRNDDSENEIRKDDEMVNLQNRASDLNDYILKTLKIESDTPLKTFESITYIKQDELKELIFDSGQTKQEYIDQLLQLNKYVDTYNALKDVISLIKEEVDVKRLEEALTVDENDLIRIESRINELKTINEVARKELSNIDNEIKSNKSGLEQAESKLKFYNEKKSEHTRLLAERYEKLSRLEKLKESISKLEREIATRNTDILNIDEKKEDTIKKRIREIEIKRDEKTQEERSAFKSLYEKKAHEKSKIDKLKDLESEISRLTSDRLKLETELSKVEKDLKDATETLSTDELNGRIKQIKIEIEGINKDKNEAINNKVCQICGENITNTAHLEKEYNSRLSEYNRIISDLSKMINLNKIGKTKATLEKDFSVFIGKRDDIIKRLEEKIKETTEVNLEEIRAVIETDNKMYEVLLSEEKLLTNELKELNLELDSINKIRNELKELEINRARKDSLESEAKKLDEELEITLSKINSIDFKQEELNESESIYKDITLLIHKLTSESSRLKGNVEARESEISENLHKLDEVKEKLKKRDELRREVEKRDNFLTLIDNLRKDIRDIREYVRNRFINDFKAIFQSRFSEIRSESEYTIDIDNDYNVKVIASNDILDAKALSGGEKTSVALAYRMALSSIASLLGGVNKNESLLMDEPTSGLDKEDINALSSCITKITDINQIIIVTHEDTMKNIADNMISVSKVTGESKISSSK